MTFGQLLEYLGRIPIPPYLNRESEEIDYTRYQTVYSKFEGSVAAPTAGLHFTPELIEGMKARGFGFEEVTLHVGAGTFLPVKDADAGRHPMHTEHFEVRRAAVARLLEYRGEHVRHGAFAVGAGHVDREIVALGIAQVLAECGDAFQSGFIGFGPLLLVRNER